MIIVDEQLKCSVNVERLICLVNAVNFSEKLRYLEMLSPKFGTHLERMKRRSNSQKFRHRWRRKLFALLLLVFCFATFLLMESEYSKIKMLSLISPPLQKPKIAFLFIARNRIPLDIVWDVFFQVIICLPVLFLVYYLCWNWS